MEFTEKLYRVFELTLPKLGPEAREQLRAVMSPESLAIIAGVLVVWVGSHFFGVGEIVDIILGVVGVVTIGLAVFTGIDHLFQFARITYNGNTDREFEQAAGHLAEAITILGITAVLAVLFRGRPQTQRGGRINVGPRPPANSGRRYVPTRRADPTLRAGEGYTTAFGDIVYSSRGSLTDQRLVLLHERVHQFLTPRFEFFRQFRVQNRTSSYERSALSRYIEEALAETIAQIGVNGVRSALVGIRFPVANGYVTVLGPGGAMTELGGLIGTASAGGMTFQIYFRGN
jgi:hypothetical protein